MDHSLIYLALKERSEKMGVSVYDDIPVPARIEKKFKGIIVTRGGQKYIAINPLLTPEEKMETMAHELGNLRLHKGMDGNLYWEQGEYHHELERQADRFAVLLIALVRSKLKSLLQEKLVH